MAPATATRRLLSSSLNPNSTAQPPETPFTVDSDFVAIIALLCALICCFSFIAAIRWTCFRYAITVNNTNQDYTTRGLDNKILNSFPKFILDLNKRGELAIDECCAICLGEFVDGEEIRVLPQCGHGFHAGCVDTWLARRASCPSCRLILDNSKRVKCDHLPTSANIPMISILVW